MKSKKVLFLSLALLLPVAVFIFLKLFGRNEFDVPALHQGRVEMPTGCDQKFASPYVLSDSIFQFVTQNGSGTLILIDFSASEEVINRVKEETQGLTIVPGAEINDQIRRCFLLCPDYADLVLIDNAKQIRGYYQSVKLDDVDRLIMEVKIILKQY